MNAVPPQWLNIVVVTSIIFISLMIWVFYSAANRIKKYYGTAFVAIGVVLVWFAVAVTLARSGFFDVPADARPRVPIPLLLGIIIPYMLYRTVKPFRALIDATPVWYFVAFQIFRAIGGTIFMFLYAWEILPWQMALPAGIGDIMVGVGAFILLYMFWKKHPHTLWWVGAWAIFGILDHLTAVTMSTLTSPGPLMHLTSFGGTNLLMSKFPLVILPAFRVPIGILLNILLLHKLHAIRKGKQNVEGGEVLSRTAVEGAVA
jgi:hypothetical protein